MLSDEQIEAIAQNLGKFKYGEDFLEFSDPLVLEGLIKDTWYIARAIAIRLATQSEQDRRSFTAVGKYIGVTFTSETDVVSAVYDKLDEIMTVFREHSQEIAIAQQIKTLNNLLEKYVKQQEASPICKGAVGEETGRSFCAGEECVAGPENSNL